MVAFGMSGLTDITAGGVGHAIKREASDATLKPIIVFVGSCVTFTDRLMHMVEVEFRGIDIVRLDDFGQLELLPEWRRTNVQLIVVDEVVANSSKTDWEPASLRFPSAVLTLAYSSPDYAREVLGSSEQQTQQVRFLPMRAPIDAWFSALRLLLLGQSFIPSELVATGIQDTPVDHQKESPAPQVMAKPLQKPKPEAVEIPGVNLTKRELEIIELLALGDRNKTIAKKLELSEHTVKLHVHHIFGKIGVRNRTSATHWYMSKQGAFAGRELE